MAIQPINTVIAQNSSSTVLANGATFPGEWAECRDFNAISVSCITDKAGQLNILFSSDRQTTHSTFTVDVLADTEVNRVVNAKWKYFKVTFTNNSGSDQTSFYLQSLGSNFDGTKETLDSELEGTSTAGITKAILFGQTDGGQYRRVPSTGEGHPEIAIHDPLLPFGSVHVESMRPVFQFDFVYGLNSGHTESFTSLSGSVTASDSLAIVSSGTTQYAQAGYFTRKRLRYRPGQGSICRFTALFTSPVANSYQLSGIGHAEDGLYFGYKDTDFGVLYVNRGVREIRTLTVTTGSSHSENVTITLNGTAFTVAVTNSANIQRTVWEIAQGTYNGWSTDVVGATVRFISASAGAKSGTYSLAGSSAAGTFAQTKAGVASTDTFVAQSDWNGDKLDGTGYSGITIDPTKLNVYQIELQYLGTGAIEFKVEVASSGNNHTWVTVHTLRLPNTLTTSSLGNPSFPFTSVVYSAGSTTDLTVKNASVGGFIEGEKYLHGNRYSYYRAINTVGATDLQALFTIMNSRVFAGRTNQGIINLISVFGALKHNFPCIFYLVKNGTLAGNPSFSAYDSTSCSLYDSAATTVTYSNNGQLLWTGHLGDTGNFGYFFSANQTEEFTLQPGEWFTLAARAASGSPSYVTGSINTREDI